MLSKKNMFFCSTYKQIIFFIFLVITTIASNNHENNIIFKKSIFKKTNLQPDIKKKTFKILPVLYSSKNLRLSKKKKIINKNEKFSKKIIIIDAGHGGQDPGAIGHTGLQEKKVNIEIALKLDKLLNNDRMFHAILTRHNDTYLSLRKRRQFLTNHNIDLLISIHADSSQKQYVSGASIWIISNNRMNREINNYLKNQQSTIYFSKKIQNIFDENQYDIFLKKTILDLQFNDFQQLELDLSKHILEQFAKNIKLHKTRPNYASLEILSCINIPSILIETGFITNLSEEKKLRTKNYQNKIAQSIYLAIKNYFWNTM